MKYIFCCTCIFFLVCCRNSSADKKDETNGDAVRREVKVRSVYEIKPDNTYVELNTGRPVKLEYDSISQAIYEHGTKRQIDLFIDEATNDTIDYKGNNQNHRLIKRQDGTYVAQEDFASPQ